MEETVDELAWDPRVVVVGVDGSTRSRHAATLAASIARRTGAKLHFVTVVSPPEGWWGIVGSPPTSAALGNTLSDAREMILESTIDELDLPGVDYEAVEDMGDPARVLIDYAKNADANLMIVGKRGAGLIERMLLGSVANRILHDAPCPVLVVP